jgi:hypothetical protein
MITFWRNTRTVGVKHGRAEIEHRIWIGNPNESYSLRGLNVSGRIILKRILNILGLRIWT